MHEDRSLNPKEICSKSEDIGATYYRNLATWLTLGGEAGVYELFTSLRPITLFIPPLCGHYPLSAT